MAGCDAEKAKIKINEILTKNQKNSDAKTIEKQNNDIEKLSKIVDVIKSNFVLASSGSESEKQIVKGSSGVSNQNVKISGESRTNMLSLNSKDHFDFVFNYFATEEDVNNNPDYVAHMDELTTTISDTLTRLGLDKKIELREHKLDNDAYTRGQYVHTSEETKNKSEDDIEQKTITEETIENGVKIAKGVTYEINKELDDGYIDIYYGDGFWDKNVSDDEIEFTPNDMRTDISLSSNLELIMHEVLHSMVEKAAEEDKELEKALFKFKEQILPRLSYKDMFANEEEFNNASQDKIQLAKDIIGYMEKPTEFLAYVATNKNFYNKVKDMNISQELLTKFVAKKGQKVGKVKEFLNRFIQAINNIYTSLTTGPSAKNEFKRILDGLIVSNTEIEVGKFEKRMNEGFKEYQSFGISEKYNKMNNFLVKAEEGLFNKTKQIWTADNVRDKAEALGTFIENIGEWRGLQWLRDSRVLSDLITDISEDTTTETVSWFYEAVRDIKGKRDKEKIDFATAMKKKVAKEFAEFEQDERNAVTFMIQGDWKALGVSIDEYKNMLQDDESVRARVDELKNTIGVAEYTNQAAMLGYYIVTGEAKGSAVMKNARQIYYRSHIGKEESPIQNKYNDDENIKMIDELASLYAIMYTDKTTKEKIISAIERDVNVVSFASNVYYSYRQKESEGQLAEFAKYMDKGYVRKSGKVDMKFDIIPESKIIENKRLFTGLNTHVIRERSDIQNLLDSDERMFLIVEKDMDPARTQGVLDDISIIESGSEIGSFTAGKTRTYEQLQKSRFDRFFADKTYLNRQIDDSIEALRARDHYSVPEVDINGYITGYSESISESDKINYGAIDNDIANVLGNTTSHIQSKEKALLNNQSFIDKLLVDSEKNAGKPGYVLVSEKSEDKELSKYWAMIPDYSRKQIAMETKEKGIWVKRSRMNNIVGYKDVSISNAVLFGKRIEDYPEWQRAAKIVEHTWKEVVVSYKEIIVKLFPNVVASNAVSNMFIAMRHGIGPMEYAKAFKTAWTDLSDYIELNDQMVSLEIDRTIGKKNLDIKINELKKRLEKNGFHALVKDGQFSVIFEDLDVDLPEKSTHLKEAMISGSKKLFGEKATEVLDEVRQNIYITKDTKAHRAIEKLTLFNDIINKKIIQDRLLENMKGMTFASKKVEERYRQDLLNYLDQLFVNYSYLLNKYVKWASDLDIIRFLKYFLRSAKASFSMTRRLPLGSAIAESLDTFVWDVPDPVDQYQNIFETLGYKVGNSPIDTALGLMFPNILNPLR